MEKPSGSLISYFSNMVKDKGGINLAQGIPGFFPPDELLSILKDYSQREKQLHQYAPGNGDFRLLELLSEYYSKYSPQQSDKVLIVQGATEGIFLVFFYLISILQGRYSALAFDPPYESYPQLAKFHKIPFTCFDYDENLTIDFEKLETEISDKNVKIVFIASPGNPLGKIWTKDELAKISFLAKKYDFYIIFDGVYEDIYFGNPPFNPLELENEKLFYINSFSKMLSITGWRIGYIIADGSHMKEIRAIHDYIGLCAPFLFQRSIGTYLENNNFGVDYTSSLRIKCKSSYSLLKRKLLPFGFKIPYIQGGYFLWAQLPHQYKDAFSFALELYEKTKVAIVPGENFSLNKRNYIRLNFAHEIDILENAVDQFNLFFEKKEPQ